MVVPTGGTTTPVACNGGAAAGDCKLRPHCVQKVALSALENPHCGHTAMLFSNQRRNTKSPLSWNDLHELTLGRGVRQCARLVPLICGLLRLFDKVPAMDQTQAPVQSCPDCAAQMPAGVRFCPGCGRSMQIIARAQGKVGVLSENVAGALAYFTILPAILFLFLEPYRKNLFVRFHALQCFLYTAAIVLLACWIEARRLRAIRDSGSRAAPGCGH